MDNNYCMGVNLGLASRTASFISGTPANSPGAVTSVPLDEIPIVRPGITEVEQHGIDTIPEHRHSTPFDLFRIQFGGANTFATVILGTFPILLGLSLWQALGATVVGVLVGALFLMPMGLFGPLTGTNNAVSSGAHFGVRGRVVGSFLSLLTAIAFYSISVWVSGDAVVGAMIRLFGISDSDLLRGVVYAILGALVIVVVVYGYMFMLLVNKVVVVGNTVMILLGVLAYSGQIDLSYDPGPDAYGARQLRPMFVLSALIVMGNPISFGAFLGDWTRYIPERTKPSSLMLATLAAQTATLVPFFFGVFTATLVAGESDYIVALINASPLWYAVLLIGVAFLGGSPPGSPPCTAPASTSPRCSPASAASRLRCSSAPSRSCSSSSGGWPST